MKIIGCDLHTRYQEIAMLEEETGEWIERRQEHESGEAREFYASLEGPVRVGIEATGHTRWFERMLAELGQELWIGDAAQIRASMVRKQKTDARDAAHLLELLLSGRFPRLWRPTMAERDLRQLVWHRQKLVWMRTAIGNQLHALAMGEGICRKKKLFTKKGRSGRWISPDPAGLAAADMTNPQSWNRYSYVSNSALVKTDPSGLMESPFCSPEFSDCGGGGYGFGYYSDPTGVCPPSQAFCGDNDGWGPSIGIGIGIEIGEGIGGGAHRPPAGGGQGGSGAPGTGSSPGGSGGIGSGENLGIPSGMPFPESDILDALGLDPTPGCDFGVCAPIGNDYLAGVGGLGTPESPFTFYVIVADFLPRVCGDFMCQNGRIIGL